MPTLTAVDRHDIHSAATPGRVLVKHVELDLNVDFLEKVLRGIAVLTVERKQDGPLVLDTRDLSIERAEVSPDGKVYQGVTFTLGTHDPILGSSLTVPLPETARYVRLTYLTRPTATGLQWLDPAQTAGQQYPFLYSQSQAIHARSWIPIQDSPGVRVTYAARVRTPPELLAVMSAENHPQAPRNGDYQFRMPQPVPPYLIALAVGDLAFESTGPRTGVYAERPLVAKAAKEFEDTEKMIQAVESLYGTYRWGRYDLLVLPPSFPFGGMENPRLTFATPTVIAGDKSLVGLVAHELAHSWSGNLVTNATWSDFWLNEGFTTYVENRIQEKVYGQSQAEMEAVLARKELQDELAKFPPADQILHVDLRGRDPDDGMTQVPYVKGATFLRQLELVFGRDTFDQFLRAYFDHFAFQSITTADFRRYLESSLFAHQLDKAKQIPLDAWLNQPGLPAGAPQPHAAAFDAVDAEATRWVKSGGKVNAQDWSTQQYLRFLQALPASLSAAKMRELDRQLHLTQTGNSEILAEWLLLAVQHNYHAADARLEEFLTTVGRRKYIKPLYEVLAKSSEGKRRAKAIYAKARSRYHPIATATIDKLLA